MLSSQGDCKCTSMPNTDIVITPLSFRTTHNFHLLFHSTEINCRKTRKVILSHLTGFCKAKAAGALLPHNSSRGPITISHTNVRSHHQLKRTVDQHPFNFSSINNCFCEGQVAGCSLDTSLKGMLLPHLSSWYKIKDVLHIPVCGRDILYKSGAKLLY